MTRIRRATMTKRKAPPKIGRYDILEITRRVEHERIRAGLAVKELAAMIGMSEWVWYKRVSGTHPFDVEELGLVADALSMPPLWPFMDADALQALFRRNGPSVPK